jgi:hypothetical protein
VILGKAVGLTRSAVIKPHRFVPLCTRPTTGSGLVGADHFAQCAVCYCPCAWGTIAQITTRTEAASGWSAELVLSSVLGFRVTLQGSPHGSRGRAVWAMQRRKRMQGLLTQQPKVHNLCSWKGVVHRCEPMRFAC